MKNFNSVYIVDQKPIGLKIVQHIKVAQARRKKVWCEKCKQYGHTIADCLDEKQEQRSRKIEKEILKRKQQLEEIDRKMHQVKKQAGRDIGKPPQDKDTRDYPVGGRKTVTKPKKSDREPEPPLPPDEGPPPGPPVGGGGGGEPQEGDDPSDPDEMRVMMRNQITQRQQRNQVSCMMRKEEK